MGLLVRYATAGPQKQPPLTGLNPLSGRHDLGVRAGLAGARTPAIAAPHRQLGAGEEIKAPIGASGIIVGATLKGHPLLVDLAAAAPGARSTVTVAGEVAYVVQLAMRSAAIGYHVLVVSARAQYWREIQDFSDAKPESHANLRRPDRARHRLAQPTTRTHLSDCLGCR